MNMGHSVLLCGYTYDMTGLCYVLGEWIYYYQHDDQYKRAVPYSCLGGLPYERTSIVACRAVPYSYDMTGLCYVLGDWIYSYQHDHW